jgi:hypothetical protein
VKLHKKGGYGFVRYERHDSAVQCIVDTQNQVLFGRVSGGAALGLCMCTAGAGPVHVHVHCWRWACACACALLRHALEWAAPTWPHCHQVACHAACYMHATLSCCMHATRHPACRARHVHASTVWQYSAVCSWPHACTNVLHYCGTLWHPVAHAPAQRLTTCPPPPPPRRSSSAPGARRLPVCCTRSRCCP